MSGDQLIVSPLKLSFLAPLSHFQKRMITMINASSEDVVFRIQIDNNTDFSVTPMRGRVNAFDTTELIVTLAPVIKDIPYCSLAVRSLPLTMIAHIEEMEWNSTNVLIELDPRKTQQLEDEIIRNHFQVNNQVKKEYNSKVSKKKTQKSKPWPRRYLYGLGILAVMIAAYLSFSL